MADKKITVWVVCSNDYPNCVFSEEDLAEKYQKKRMSDPKNVVGSYGRRVYYHIHDLVLDEEGRDVLG